MRNDALNGQLDALILATVAEEPAGVQRGVAEGVAAIIGYVVLGRALGLFGSRPDSAFRRRV